MSSDGELSARFVAAFQRAIEREVAAMRTSGDAFELTLTRGEALGGPRYGFELAEPSERIAAGSEATLRTARGEARVMIERCVELRVTLTSDQPLDLTARPFALLVAPWFLYERLVQALAGLSAEHHAIERGLVLFGKRPHRRTATELGCDHTALNPSQRAAVQLCSDSDLAFLWGPPGTGKTATLTHVVEELLAQGRRILLASTTNAAIDQVLAKMAARPWLAPAIADGRVVRLGRSDDETFGAELADAVGRAQGTHGGALDRLRARVAAVELQLRNAEPLCAELAAAIEPQQSLFATPSPGLRASALAGVFAMGLAEVLTRRTPSAQAAALDVRVARLARIRTLARAQIAVHAAAIRDLEAQVVDRARVVMCTLTNAYLSPLMAEQRFDVLIAEEAGMAALPALFYAACLCTGQAIMVGDPRQLPPIVHARDDLVQRTLGRNVFDVTVGDPLRSDVVALLDIQYRMHPVIGDLVGRLFYGGRLQHGADPTRSAAIAARAPYPDQPLIVVDTARRTTCERAAKGSSRVNPASAERTSALALEAVTAGGSVAVITPYAAQAREIRQRLAARRIADVVECSTIHRFQGRECDVVIIDLVDAAPMRPGVLLAGSGPAADAWNLLNVSISRARGKLIIVADVGFFADHAPAGVVTTILGEAIRGGVRVA